MNEPTLRDRAIALYKTPFKFSMGYIWDVNNKLVAGEIEDANLQDEVGKLIAELLTEHWNKEAK